jgi:hypothetical protein
MNKLRGRRLTVALVLLAATAGVLTQFASFMFLVSAALLVAALVIALR